MPGKGSGRQAQAKPKAKVRRGGRFGGIRSNADRALGQGVGMVTKKAFGDKASKRSTLAVWDAKLPAHLALPRAVGPYTTIRTTVAFKSASTSIVFGSFWYPETSSWSNTCAYAAVDSTLPINAANNTQSITYDLDGLGPATTAVPSAITVQIMNANPLQTTAGIFYAGVSNSQFAFDGDSATYDARWAEYVQFQGPRVLSAGKLALRGVQISSYPLNMTRCAEFAPIVSEPNVELTWVPYVPTLQGWAPIVMVNPSKVTLDYLVTMEWRVRFDLANPASAGHTHHNVASDHEWDLLARKACALGNGCMDIVETVANHGY